MKLYSYSKARLKNIYNKKRSSTFPPPPGEIEGAYHGRKNNNEQQRKTDCSRSTNYSVY